VSSVEDMFNWGTKNVWFVESIKLISSQMHVVFNTITVSIIDGSFFEWSEFSGESKELKVFWSVDKLHVVVEFSFLFDLDHLVLIFVV